MYFAYYAYDSFTERPHLMQRHKCACAIQFHVAGLMNRLIKMASNSKSNLCSRSDSPFS